MTPEMISAGKAQHPSHAELQLCFAETPANESCLSLPLTALLLAGTLDLRVVPSLLYL